MLQLFVHEYEKPGARSRCDSLKYRMTILSPVTHVRYQKPVSSIRSPSSIFFLSVEYHDISSYQPYAQPRPFRHTTCRLLCSLCNKRKPVLRKFNLSVLPFYFRMVFRLFFSVALHNFRFTFCLKASPLGTADVSRLEIFSACCSNDDAGHGSTFNAWFENRWSSANQSCPYISDVIAQISVSQKSSPDTSPDRFFDWTSSFWISKLVE